MAHDDGHPLSRYVGRLGYCFDWRCFDWRCFDLPYFDLPWLATAAVLAAISSALPR